MIAAVSSFCTTASNLIYAFAMLGLVVTANDVMELIQSYFKSEEG